MFRQLLRDLTGFRQPLVKGLLRRGQRLLDLSRLLFGGKRTIRGGCEQMLELFGRFARYVSGLSVQRRRPRIRRLQGIGENPLNVVQHAGPLVRQDPLA